MTLDDFQSSTAADQRHLRGQSQRLACLGLTAWLEALGIDAVANDVNGLSAEVFGHVFCDHFRIGNQYRSQHPEQQFLQPASLSVFEVPGVVFGMNEMPDTGQTRGNAGIQQRAYMVGMDHLYPMASKKSHQFQQQAQLDPGALGKKVKLLSRLSETRPGSDVSRGFPF